MSERQIACVLVGIPMDAYFGVTRFDFSDYTAEDMRELADLIESESGRDD